MLTILESATVLEALDTSIPTAKSLITFCRAYSESGQPKPIKNKLYLAYLLLGGLAIRNGEKPDRTLP